MQTTLDCVKPSVPEVTVESTNSTILTDEHIDYLYEQSPHRILERQVEKHLEDIENEEIEIRRRYEDFLKYEKPSKSQEYIRVGKHNDN